MSFLSKNTSNNIASIKMKEQFGPFCANGPKAIDMLHSQILPQINLGFTIHFDFKGVNNMSTSFSNALFGNLVRARGRLALKKVRFQNTSPCVKTMIKMGISIGQEAPVEAEEVL